MENDWYILSIKTLNAILQMHNDETFKKYGRVNVKVRER